MAWKLPDGKVINTPKAFTHDGLQYPAQIFRSWSKEELAAIGVKPYREVSYDQKWYKSTGFVEEEIDGEIVKTHTTTNKLTNSKAKEDQVSVVRGIYLSELPRAQILEDFYDAVGDSTTKKLWSDYITALKNDAKILKDEVDAAGTYDAIINLQFQWTPAPDTEEVSDAVTI
jgi:hypothetical protein